MSDILLIEDNKELANLIQAFLSREGFSLCTCTSGEDALQWLQHHHADIVLLDIMLPGMDGFQVLEQIRKQRDIAIVIISARSTKHDQLLGFELGADDYLEKPVDTDILCAKIRAIWARNRYVQQAHSVLSSGELTIDVDAHKVFLHSQLLDLNTKEFELLVLLVKNKGKTMHKDYIFAQIWGMESESEAQTLTVHIKMLRKKIEEDPRKPQRIQTVWGVGYRYEEV